MVTHWESSCGPLYVRTVWRDGQHHVLRRRDEEPHRKSPAVPSRGLRSGAKSAIARKTPPFALVLAGVNGVSSHQQRRCKTSVQRQAQKSPETFIDVKKIAKTSPRVKPNKNLNLSIKSHSLEIHLGKDLDGTHMFLPYFNHGEGHSNSLSQRVLMWLDLATQTRSPVKEEGSRENVTPAITKKLGKTLIKERITTSQFGEETEEGILVEGVAQSVQMQKKAILNEASEGPRLAQKVALKESDRRLSLTSQLEENVLETSLEVLPKNRMSAVKRQLHIFMPNLPKKFSDCDSSILSSKISSSGNSVNSRKI